MHSDPFSSTTPAAAGIDNPDCVKWTETLVSHEESAGKEVPMGQTTCYEALFPFSSISALPALACSVQFSFILKSDWGPDPSDARPLLASQCGLYVLTLFIFKAPNYVLARTLTERVV